MNSRSVYAARYFAGVKHNTNIFTSLPPVQKAYTYIGEAAIAKKMTLLLIHKLCVAIDVYNHRHSVAVERLRLK